MCRLWGNCNMEVQKSITEEKKENNEDEGIEIKTKDDLRVAKFGDSDKLQTGDFVIEAVTMFSKGRGE